MKLRRKNHHRNKYEGNCEYCGKHIDVGEGYYDYVYVGKKTVTDRQHFKKYRFFCVCNNCIDKHFPIWA